MNFGTFPKEDNIREREIFNTDRRRLSRCRLILIIIHIALLSAIAIFGTIKYLKKEIAVKMDGFILGLNYSDADVLIFAGETITSKIVTEGKLGQESSFIVTKREKKTLSNTQSDVGVIASNIHRTYPGAILLANSKLLDNNPDILQVSRADMVYTIDLPGMSEKDSSSFVIKPSYTNYQNGVNLVLKHWFEVYAPHYTTPANFQSKATLAYSEDQLRVALGAEFHHIISIDFEKIKKNEKAVLIQMFKQVFYTVSITEPNRPSSVFGDEVTADELREMRVNNDNPPVIIDSVTYGRAVYCKIETSSTDDDTKFTLRTKLTKLDSDLDVDYSKSMKDFSMQVYVMGGSNSQIEILNATTLADVNKVLMKYGELTRDNPGFPLTYSTIFLRDNGRATIQSTSEYVETSREVFKQGTLSIKHHGWYVTQWEIYWSELSYDENGKEVLQGNHWYKNWYSLTAPFNELIHLPGNCQKIRVYAKGATGLAWDRWHDIINYYNLPLVEWRTFETLGWTLGMYPEITPKI